MSCEYWTPAWLLRHIARDPGSAPPDAVFRTEGDASVIVESKGGADDASE